MIPYLPSLFGLARFYAALPLRRAPYRSESLVVFLRLRFDRFVEDVAGRFVGVKICRQISIRRRYLLRIDAVIFEDLAIDVISKLIIRYCVVLKARFCEIFDDSISNAWRETSR